MTDILILGGTGTVGRRVAARLRAAGRTARTAARTGGDVPFDLGDPGTWAPALDGVTAAYLMEPDLRTSIDRRARVPAFVAEATAAGVRRLVLLSAPAADEDGHPLKIVEEAVRDSGADWTVLRPTWFSQNFGEKFWRPGILAGTLSLPAGDGRAPFVDAEDIAEVAVSALTEDRHAGQVYELTGPRAIGFGEAAGLIGAAVGRVIHYDDADPAVHVERQVAHGVPPEVARLLTGLLAGLRDGVGGAVLDGVDRALGRPPRPFEEYVAETAAAGLWT
ncbi:NAD(P)H-binding protein [Microbispora corallina]|uniref:NmrA family transcriptional regulator n=1 Tax=Microbispora corallina TaxID=83302 RepID=A0ABQ4GBA6_9ACTN|nr:NAD(P)H-binding protein [Microbispora corallina]GIH44317.1 NmrA family transcriptional regulator [Microbispora corallina]